MHTKRSRQPVAVEVDPHCRRAERLASAQAAGAGHIDKCALAGVAKETVLSDACDEHIGESVVVEITDGDAHAVDLDVEPGRARHVRERAIAVVVVEPKRRALLGMARPVHPVDKQDVLPAIAVVVDEGAPRAHRLGEELAAVGAAVVAKLEAGGRRRVDEAKARALAPRALTQAAARPRRQRQRDAEKCVDSRPNVVEGSQRVDEAVLQRVHDELGGLVDAQRVHDVGAMNGNGVHAEIQLGGDFAVGEPVANQLEHFGLARRQAS